MMYEIAELLTFQFFLQSFKKYQIPLLNKPTWIIGNEFSKLVLGLYILVLLVALSFFVRVWYYQSVKNGRKQLLPDTIKLYYDFINKTPNMTLKRVIMILAASSEFTQVVLKPRNNFDKPLLDSLFQLYWLREQYQNLIETNQEPLCFEYSTNTRVLIHLHLNRIQLPPDTLEQANDNFLKKCPYLLQAFVQCASDLTMEALAGKISRMTHLNTVENAMRLCPMIVQGLWNNKYPLFQLPHVTEKTLQHLQYREHDEVTLLSLATMKTNDRRAILWNLSEDQYDDAMNILAKMPKLEMEVCFGVPGNKKWSSSVTASATTTVTVTLHRKEMANVMDKEFSSLPEENAGECRESEFEDSDMEQSEEEEEEEEECGEMPKDEEKNEEWLEFQQEMAKKNILITNSTKSHSVHCPYFPLDKQEYWWIYIIQIPNKKSNTLVTMPYLMTDLVDKKEVELKFTAPKVRGTYKYAVIARSDSYMGLNVFKIITLVVRK